MGKRDRRRSLKMKRRRGAVAKLARTKRKALQPKQPEAVKVPRKAPVKKEKPVAAPAAEPAALSEGASTTAEPES
jgi:hypothetical protein